MGELIILAERRRLDRSTRPGPSLRPTFHFDPACPFSYLAAERVERILGEVNWEPTSAAALDCEPGALDCEPGALDCEPRALDWEPGPPPRARAQAERRAVELRLPLVWPGRYPAGSLAALRAASYAAEVGAGAPFALAACRLAFCGGFELDDPETLAEAAAAAGIRLEPCLVAAGDSARDGPLHARGRELLALGVRRLPAVRIGRRYLQGESALEQAAALGQPAALVRGRGLLARSLRAGSPRPTALAPVG